jgi:hypothetical protein
VSLIDDFNGFLARAGWQVDDFSELFRAGVAVDPLGIARYEGERTVLEAQWSSNGELKLFILEKAEDRLIRLIFVPSEGNMSRVLTAITDEQESVDAGNFPTLIHKVRHLSEAIFFVDHNGQRFNLEFES